MSTKQQQMELLKNKPAKAPIKYLIGFFTEDRMIILRRYFPFIVLIFVGIIFSLITEQFASERNFETVLRQACVLVIGAMGGTFVILAGSIDLSVGSVTGLSSVICAAIVALYGGSAGILMGVITGVLCGLCCGFIFAKLKVPSFIVTLGLLVAGHGLILIITQGRPIMIRDTGLRAIGSGVFLGIPKIVIIAALALLLAYIIHRFTTLGRSIIAVGGGEIVAKRSGISVERIKILIFVLAGFYAGVAGVVLTLRMGAGSPTAGAGLELDVIASVVLGGTPLTGGTGGPAATIIGAMIMAVLSNGLNLAGVSSYTQLVIKGAVLVFAVMISFDRKKIGIIK